jgi:hypothetical protein
MSYDKESGRGDAQARGLNDGKDFCLVLNGHSFSLSWAASGRCGDYSGIGLRHFETGQNAGRFR